PMTNPRRMTGLMGRRRSSRRAVLEVITVTELAYATRPGTVTSATPMSRIMAVDTAVPIIEFGPRESLLSVGVRGAVGGKSTYIVPKFGKGCVCCGNDAMGRTQDYDPSTD